MVLLVCIVNYNELEWGDPYFAQPKLKSNQNVFLDKLISSNKKLKYKPYPMPNINEMLLEMEGFQHTISLDLNIRYYHIKLNEDANNLCIIILPWRKYRHKHLPMIVSSSSDILQQKRNDLFQGFEFIHACLEKILILTKGD